jgi:LPXTG-motif cell wall-anchored protein
MKNFKKVMALLMASLMLISALSLSTFASSAPTYEETLEVSGFVDGDSVNFYKILKYDDSGNGGAYGGWNLAAPFDKIIGKTITIDINAGTTETIDDEAEAVEMIITHLYADLAGKLAKLADDNSKIPPTSNANGTATLEIADESAIGMYMALISPADAKYTYSPVFVSSYYDQNGQNSSWIVDSTTSVYYDKAAVKKSVVGVKKEADGGDVDHYSYDLDWKSTRPGEIVDYTVETTIPGYGPVFEHPHFVVKDALTDLKLSTEPVVTSPANAVYTVTPNPSVGGTAYTITFDEDWLRTCTVPTPVVIEYSAEVTTPQQFWNINRQDNEVWVEYNHDTTDESKFEWQKDDTYHYTYSIDADLVGGYGEGLIRSGSEIVKIGLGPDKKTPITSTKTTSVHSPFKYQEGPLEGATFTLYAADGTTEYVNAKGQKYNLKSDSAGRIKIEGLDAGVYYLKEDTAPSGFIKDPRKIKIEIVPTFEPQDITMWTDGNDWKDAKDSTHIYDSTYSVDVLKDYTVYVNDQVASKYVYQFRADGGKTMTWIKDSTIEVPSSIVNTQGIELPSTGGIGTTIFYLVGAVLVVSAGVVLVTRRRMSSIH